MRTAETVLDIIRERGKRKLPLEDIYRQLYNPSLYLRAYGRLYGNKGAMTPGSTSETVDEMSQAKIEQIIELVRYERLRWTPVRRTYIAKKNSNKKRPLGLPSWSDKLLQEVMRSLLEAYYEPQFSSNSHGFRRGRGCHTALTQIDRQWTGTTWFIEGDIARCFDSIDHQILLSILSEKLHDNRFLRLISNLLKAGYMEDWRFNKTLSGTPQGGVLSPILANIYLDRLDKFVETTLLTEYNCGKTRRNNREYKRLMKKARRLKKKGHYQEAKEVRRQGQALPSYDTHDPNYRRLRYVRYADDVLLGFTGPLMEAQEIKLKLATFLHQELKLELSMQKTLITNARSQAARFLGYEITLLHQNAKLTNGRRSINGRIRLQVPVDVVKTKCQAYMRKGKPIHRSIRIHDSDYSIVAQYQAEYRGLVQYYQLADNLYRFSILKWVMERSLTMTLAKKHRTSVRQILKRYRTTIKNKFGYYKVLKVEVKRPDSKSLVAIWGGIPLRRNLSAIINDRPFTILNTRTELVQRLLADRCEICGSIENVEVHHIRRLADVKKKGQNPQSTWAKMMATRRRKTLVVCRKCHSDIHAGRPVNRDSE